MNGPWLRGFLAILALLAPAGAAPADTVKLTGRAAFYHVKLVDFRGHRLVFRGVSRQQLRKPLQQVEWLAVAGLPELNEAERAFAAANWQRAAIGYEDALSHTEQPWLRRLIQMRLLAAADRAGRFDRAVDLLLGLLPQGPIPSEYLPRHPGPVGSPVNRAALASLREALGTPSSAGTDGVLPRLHLELSLYEGEPDRGLAPKAPPGKGVSSQPASAPVEPLGILPGLGDPGASAPTSAPAAVLTADSFLLSAARQALDTGHHEWAAALIRRALPYVHPADAAPYRLVLGRCWIELGRYPQAASELLAVATGSPDARQATAALYYAGLAHERMGRTDVARQMYREALETFGVSPRVEALAREGLRRVRP